MDSKIMERLAEDVRLREIMPLITLPPLETDNNIYLDLLSSIVSQQLSTKVATVIFNRFIQLFPDCDPTPEKLNEIDVGKLRRCGLSYQKGGYLKNVAAHWIEHYTKGLKDWLAMDDDEIIADLTQIKGVGKWTVQMILMFQLGRLDILPLDDLGIRQGIVKLYHLEELKGKPLLAEMTRVAENWRPYRSVACRYLWKWNDLFKRQNPAAGT